MLKTVEAEIDTNGVVTLLEPLTVSRKTRAVVTLLEETTKEPESCETPEPDNALYRWLKTKDDNPKPKFPAKIIATDLPVQDRSLEYEWLAENHGEYDGKYVALEGNTLIAASENGKDLAAKLKKLGIMGAFITFVESSNRPPFISGGFWRE